MQKTAQHQPPAWAERFLEWYCAPELLEDLLGDLHELYGMRLRGKGVFYARTHFILDVFLFLKPYVFRRRSQLPRRNLNLFRHYLKTGFRNVNRDKQYLSINTLGLALGMASALVLIAYIYNELSFDRHFKNSDRIYRISCSTLIDHTYTEFAPIPPAIGLALKEELPEIESLARFQYLSSSASMKYKDNFFFQDGMFLADSTIFRVLSYEFLVGNEKALQGPDRIVLTHSLAVKIFGEDYLDQKDLLNAAIQIQGRDFAVAGVIKDPANNTHVQPVAFIGWHGYAEDNIWNDSHAYTYILLRKDADPVNVQDKMNMFTAENDNIRKVATDFGAEVKVFIQPLKDLHLYSSKMYELSSIGNVNYIYAFAVIALFFLFSSAINYTNLAIAASSHRYKEIGVRKVMGALRDQIQKQFITESALMTFFSALLGLFLFYLLIPRFNQLMDYQLDMSLLLNAKFPLIAIAVIVLLSTFSGFYPAYYLSMVNPILVFKNNISTGGQKMRFRKTLLLAQFTISAIMIIAVLAVTQQMNFLRNKELGFNKENIIMISFPGGMMKHLPVLKEELSKLPGVSAVAACSYTPGPASPLDEHLVERANGEMKSTTIARIFFDKDYIKLLGLKFVEGRDFDPDSESDNKYAFLVNEAAVKAFGWDKTAQGAIGRVIDAMNYGKKGEVIGVVKDVNLFSLKHQVEPLIMNLSTHEAPLYVKMNGSNIMSIMSSVEKTYKKVMENTTMDYHFLDDRFDKIYDADRKMNAALMSGAQILIFISCLGLFGLSAFMVTQRTKEIGVRKVLGASIFEIMSLLSKDYIRLIVIANLIAIPLGYLFITMWLESYAYRVELQWWLMFTPLAATLLLSLASISYQVIKASRTNPVNVLKYE